jgi:ATP-dependent RNA helicase DeaD
MGEMYNKGADYCMKSFESLGVSERTLEVLKQKGYEVPTKIQELVIPVVMDGDDDIVAQAQTGTGKTAAFGIPLIELLQEKSRTVQTLVLTPTRELAIQVAEEINSLKGWKELSIIPVYGGQSMSFQLRNLRKGVDVVVGTPGRILDHLRNRTLKLDGISYLVLDEADEMLDMGFIDDVEEIISYTAANKRTMLFSATMPHEVIEIAKKHMRTYETLKVEQEQLTVSQTDQIYFEVSAADKFEALCRIIDVEEEFYGLIFCRTKVDADKVAGKLKKRGYDADALHGDMSQNQRERTLNKFKRRQLNILVATDVAARGIDVQNLTHVINYALPQDSKSYVHRVGRTGRAGREGNAITFITPEEYRRLKFISRETKTDIRKARLPQVKDVIERRKKRIKSELENIFKTRPGSEYFELSKELLENQSPEELIAALLHYSFRDELDGKSYTEIGDAVVDLKGKTRLFVTKGKQHRLTPKKLVNFIRNKCNIRSEKINDIKIHDKYSFVTLPFHEAEQLLSYFKERKKGSEPFIMKAKESREHA